MDTRMVLRYLGFFAIFVAIGVVMNVFSGQPIDWFGNILIAVILLVGWVFIDQYAANKTKRDAEKKRNETKNLTKAEKKAYAAAEEARKKRAMEAAAAGNAEDSKKKRRSK